MIASYVAFALDPERLWGAYGCNDRALLDRALTESADEAPDGRTALAAYIAGTPPHPARLHRNLHIVALLTTVLGKQLASDGWGRTSADFVAAVDFALGKSGVRLSLYHLFHRWPPDHVPARNAYHFEDTPLGFLDAAEVAALAPALQHLELPDTVDEDVAAAVADLRRWVLTAAGQGVGLVCLNV